MKSTVLLKVISLTLVLVAMLSAFASCKSSDEGKAPDDGEKNENLYDISGYTIIRQSGSSDDIADVTATLKRTIEKKIGPSLTVSLDDEKENAKEILIGETNRKESADALAVLNDKTDEDAYIVSISENKIVLTGKSDKSTIRAVKIFLDTYVAESPAGNAVDISAGKSLAGVYDPEKIITTANGTEFEIKVSSDVFDMGAGSINTTLIPGEYLVITGVHYPSITQLQYQQNEEDNGKLVAIFDLAIQGENTRGCVMLSENEGKSWKFIARPQEEFDKTLTAGQMAHIYELPVQIGDMPAGTLLYSANSCDYSRKSTLAIWRSFDCGKTWDQYALLNEAGGLEEGIWEPFITYCEEDQYLYCFYSDDSDPDHDQKLVYQRTKDGVNWSDTVDVVAYDEFKYRAGMPVITKMGNGEYFLVYEVVTTGAPVYYKKTKNLADWGDTSEFGTLIKTADGKQTSSSPSCVWLPVGGECGTLLVTGKYSSNNGYMLVSFDYGETWEHIDDPLASPAIKSSGDRVGYAAGLWVGADGKTVYYINTCGNEYDRQKISFVKFRIY